jgi:AmiR/NasT family two-component response regulator
LSKINCADVSVLVIDDQKISRELINQNLLSMGFADIDMAATSAEAEEKIAAKAAVKHGLSITSPSLW